MEPVAGADSDAPQQQLKKDPELVTQAREALKAQGSSPESQVDVVATSLDAAGSALLDNTSPTTEDVTREAKVPTDWKAKFVGEG